MSQPQTDKINIAPWHLANPKKHEALTAAGWALVADGQAYKEPGEKGACWACLTAWRLYEQANDPR